MNDWNFNTIYGLKLALATVIKEECINDWLNMSNQAFCGRKPIELAKNKEWELLRNIVYCLQSGTPF